MKKLFAILVLSVFLLSMASASILDLKRTIDTEGLSYDLNGKEIEYNKLWEIYSPIEIRNILGKVKQSIVLTDHTDVCGNSNTCLSKMEIYLADDGVLIEDNKFYTLQDDGDWIEQDIRWSKFEYWGDVDDYETQCYEEIISKNYTETICDQVKVGTHKGWVNYNLGDEVIAGNYEVQLLGEKKPSRTVDWRIKTQGKVLEELAVWGNISEGDDAEVILNSPADSSTFFSNPVTFNASANITNGATLINMSLWNNLSGGWLINETQNVSKILQQNLNEVVYAADDTLTFKKNFTDINTSVSNTIGFYSHPGGGGNCRVHFKYYYEDSTTDTNESRTSSGTFIEYNLSNPNIGKSVNFIELYISRGGSSGTCLEKNTSIIGNPTFSTETFSKTITNDIIWNVQTCDSDGDCGFAPSNYSLFIDASSPSIDLISPNETFNYLKEGGNLYLAGFTNDTNLDTCWYNYNSTNTTFSCTSETLFNETFNQGNINQLNLTVYVNDTIGNLNSQTTTWDYKVWENSRTLNNQSFETKSETFEIDLTANASLTEVTLLYNSTEYDTTKSGTTYSTTLDVPIGAGNNSIRWKLTYGAETIHTDYSYQQVNETIFTLCNATYTDDYLNISFQDESTMLNINGTIQSSIFTYYLGSGTVNKAYLYSDSGNASEYTFCATPNETMSVLPYVNYLGDGYPNRIWEPELQSYTSNVTEQLLYLLASTDGIYVTFITSTSFNSAISGVDIEISRLIGGDVTVISQGVTDSAGSFTAWLNPNYDHQIIATKTGYTTNTQTIRPTGTSYTLVMSTGVSEYTYVSDYEGLKWFVFPGVGIRNSTESTEFGFNITANNGNLVNCKIELLNQEKTLVLSSAISSSINGTSCEVKVAHSMSSTYPKVKGRLLVDVGSGYQLLEDDAYWVYLTVDSTGMTFTDWFNSMKTLDLTYFNGDEQHREYTYILVFFLFVMIICAVLNQAGWDIQNPGGMIFLVGTLVWIASVPGFLTLNYISPFVWMDKFFVAGVYSLFMIGYATRSFN